MIKAFNKDGQIVFSAVMFAFIKLIIIMFVLFTLIFFIRRFIYFEDDTTELESEIFFNSLLNSRHGPSFVDEETGRVYPGLIELSFFNNPNELEDAFSLEQKFLAAKISLYNSTGGRVVNGKAVHQVYFKKDDYRAWKEISEMSFAIGQDTGPGDIADYTKKQYVNIRAGEKVVPGYIEVKVLMLKS
ncbi:MAG: hypothetical protein ACOCQX_04355 [Candidatus Nanoarchaeia archaeon]